MWRKFFTEQEYKNLLGKVTKIIPTQSISLGKHFPSVKLTSTSGRTVNISEVAKLKNVVVFFYPGDKEGLKYPEFMGCTPQACSFRNSMSEFTKLNTVIYGISFQKTEKQQEFSKREHLNFGILSDEKKELAAAIGLPYWQSDKGEEYPSRQTFIIEKGNVVYKIFDNINPENHISEVINAISNIGGESKKDKNKEDNNECDREDNNNTKRIMCKL